MSTIENCLDSMNFIFNGNSAVCIDILSGDRWIYSDALIEGCKQNYEFFSYVCNQTFILIEKHVKADEDAHNIVEEMKKSACSLKSFNDKLGQFILECKNSFMNNKDYVFASEILHLLNEAKIIAFTMLNDANAIINASFLRNSGHDSYICSLLEHVVSDEYLKKYKSINDELCNLNSMSENEMNSIVKLSDNAVKTTEAA